MFTTWFTLYTKLVPAAWPNFLLLLHRRNSPVTEWSRKQSLTLRVRSFNPLKEYVSILGNMLFFFFSSLGLVYIFNVFILKVQEIQFNNLFRHQNNRKVSKQVHLLLLFVFLGISLICADSRLDSVSYPATWSGQTEQMPTWVILTEVQSVDSCGFTSPNNILTEKSAYDGTESFFFFFFPPCTPLSYMQPWNSLQASQSYWGLPQVNMFMSQFTSVTHYW